MPTVVFIQYFVVLFIIVMGAYAFSQAVSRTTFWLTVLAAFGLTCFALSGMHAKLNPVFTKISVPLPAKGPTPSR